MTRMKKVMGGLVVAVGSIFAVGCAAEPGAPYAGNILERSLQEQSFQQWFQGVQLTPEERRFAQGEVVRYQQEFDRFVNDRRARNATWTPAEAAGFEQRFLERLNARLSPLQVSQVQANLERIGRESAMGR